MRKRLMNFSFDPADNTSAQAYLFITRFKDAPIGIVEQRYRGFLSQYETNELERLCLSRDRRRYVISHALVRYGLSKLTSTPPQAITIDRNVDGSLAARNIETAEAPLAFSLSHTDEVAVLAVAKGPKIGVDVERIDMPPPYDVAPLLFSNIELQALSTMSDSPRQLHFWKIWTLRESYAKALRTGLSEDLKKTTFDVRSYQDIRLISGEDGLIDDNWKLQLRSFEDHLIAICLNTSRRTLLKVTLAIAKPTSLLGWAV